MESGRSLLLSVLFVLLLISEGKAQYAYAVAFEGFAFSKDVGLFYEFDHTPSLRGHIPVRLTYSWDSGTRGLFWEAGAGYFSRRHETDSEVHGDKTRFRGGEVLAGFHIRPERFLGMSSDMAHLSFSALSNIRRGRVRGTVSRDNFSTANPFSRYTVDDRITDVALLTGVTFNFRFGDALWLGIGPRFRVGSRMARDVVAREDPSIELSRGFFFDHEVLNLSVRYVHF